MSSSLDGGGGDAMFLVLNHQVAWGRIRPLRGEGPSAVRLSAGVGLMSVWMWGDMGGGDKFCRRRPPPAG